MLMVWIGMTCVLLLLLFIYMHLRKDIRSCKEQIRYIQKEDTTMKIARSTSSKDLKEIVSLFEKQREYTQKILKEYHQKDQRMKEMISNISHDIRTPLTSISGYIEMLQNANEGEKKTYLHIITERLKDMEGMLDSFFTYTKLQAYETDMELKPQPIYPILCEVVLSYYEQLHEKGLDPVIKCEQEDGKGWIHMESLQRIFQNLIMNAYRYGKAPFRITLTQEKEQLHCMFSNRVDGRLEEPERIFERFYQVDKTRTQQGNGLGLAIVKELCDHMHIEIEASMTEENILKILMKIPMVYLN